MKALDEYRSPQHKVLALLKKGRDDLRVKYREVMDQRRVAENQVRAVEKQLGWLRGFRRALGTWSELCAIGQASCSVVRRFGYSTTTAEILSQALGSGSTPEGNGLITEIVVVVKQQCEHCQAHDGRLPGSSEVIESLIGRGKHPLGTSQNNNSLTGQFLSIAASTIELSGASLRESLKRCRIKHLRDWVKTKIVPGIHVARKEDLVDPDFGTKLAQA